MTPLKTKDKKDKTKSTGPKVRNRNAKLQLKGRIFMTNVTDVVAISKTGKYNDNKGFMASFNNSAADCAGSYTVQIYWKGDPGVENFMIKFQNEEMMKKWAAGLDQQRKENAPQQAPSAQTDVNFTSLAMMNGLQNPYYQPDEEDDDESPGPTPTTSMYAMQLPPQQQQALPGTMPRNASSASLRQRSATGDSTQSLVGMARAPPPRFPVPQPPGALSLQTQMSAGQQSPLARQGPDAASYFSPTTESPASSRASTTSGYFQAGAGYMLPKSGTPQPGGWDDQNRYTAPAMPRAPSRDGPSPANAYGMVGANGRNPRGPSMPVMASQSGAQAQAQFQQQRSRSYSTPDINGQQMNPRRQNGQSVPAVPGIPPHLTHERHDSNIPRSNTGSPANVPIRSATQSPSVQLQRDKAYGGTMAQFPTQPAHPRQSTPSNGMNTNSSLPPPGPPPAGMAPMAPQGRGMTQLPAVGGQQLGEVDFPMPTQLKVKVNCDSGNYVTLVVAFNITYQSLIDRIDAKLNRFTSSSIGKGNLKLRYQDEDGDFVTIESDDDIQIAISEWREGMRNTYAGPGGVGEIELFCVGEME